MIRKALLAVFALMLLSQAGAEEGVIIPGVTDAMGERTIVAVNSIKWQDAYLASVYANLQQLPMRYIQDPFQTSNFMQELSTNKLQRIYLFSRKDSAVPSLIYLLHSQNLDVRETTYEDHKELSAKMLELLPSDKVIVVRDDFAFDAISAKYLSQTLQAPVIFSDGAEGMDPRVLAALKAASPSEVYLIGRQSDGLEKILTDFKLIKLQGRDEFDTNNIVNEYAAGGIKYEQGVITPGDIYELTLMNIRDQPIFLVPDFGVYSLPRTAGIITDANMKVLLGIGRLVTGPAQWLHERTGAKVLIKFATVRTNPADAGMVKSDVNINLEGYNLPVPKYDGKITDVDPAYAEPLGPATGALVQSNRPPAPPVEFRSYFENTGNIDFPAYVILEIRNAAGELTTTLRSERQMVYPKRQNVFRVRWDSPPAEGSYSVDAKVFGDVYEGLNLPGVKKQFDLSWMIVLINLLLLLIAMLVLAAAIYSSHVLSRDIRSFGRLYAKSIEQFDSLTKFISNLYHFRGKKR
ncbi:MAG TPA: hypothetical protein VJI13_04815 [Candidatus Norongarragalinales archaeon]|nr:hypothetical protein [Candidatus Norongarragalinales archaeon]